MIDLFYIALKQWKFAIMAALGLYIGWQHLQIAHKDARIAGLEADLAVAGFHLAAERGNALPTSVGALVGPRPARVRRRGHDWAQVVPEWGLAGNAAMSLPIGLAPEDGLPVGLQIMAPSMADDRLYNVGAALETALRDKWGHLLIEEAPAL